MKNKSWLYSLSGMLKAFSCRDCNFFRMSNIISMSIKSMNTFIILLLKQKVISRNYAMYLRQTWDFFAWNIFDLCWYIKNKYQNLVSNKRKSRHPLYIFPNAISYKTNRIIPNQIKLSSRMSPKCYEDMLSLLTIIPRGNLPPPRPPRGRTTRTFSPNHLLPHLFWWRYVNSRA